MSVAVCKQYEETKTSVVQWAGKIPAHWKVQRIGYLFRESAQRASTNTELDYPILSVSIHDGISDKEMDEDEMDRKVTRSDDRSLYKVVQDNDLAYNMMRAWQGGFGATQVNGLISPAYVVCKPRTSLPSKFFELLLRTPTAVTELKRFSRGITDFRLRLYWDDFKKIEVAVPPANEQQQILKFLDYETAKIDALIEKQQQLIALLGEKRQAVISHAVTKGLNPDAPMRDSGVEWLGEVPEHWKVTRLKFLVSQVADCHHSTPHYDDGAQWPALRTSDVFAGVLDVENARRIHTSEYLERISRLKPETGDVIYAREGGRWGIAAPVPEGADVCLAQRVMLLRGNDRMMSQFVMWSLNSRPIYHQLAVNVVGSASPHVNIGDVLEVWVAEPPITEQPIIISRLEHSLSKLDSLDEQCVKVIDTLQERRTALISAAVTGKIDVRVWKRPSTGSQLETEMEVA